MWGDSFQNGLLPSRCITNFKSFTNSNNFFNLLQGPERILLA
jgi:hypothetical protein